MCTKCHVCDVAFPLTVSLLLYTRVVQRVARGPHRGPPCYLVWPVLRLTLLKNFIAELNALLCLICWFSFEPLKMYIYVYTFLL